MFSSGLEIYFPHLISITLYMVALFMIVLIWLGFVNHRIGQSSTSNWQTPSNGERIKLIFKKTILKTDDSILVMIIKCGTDSKIVLSNLIVILK